MRVGSAEVGGLIEVVEFDARARPGVDTRSPASTSAAAGGCARPSAGCTRVELRLQYGVAGGGIWSLAVGAARGPDRARQRQAHAGAAQAGGRARAGARRGGAAPGGKGMRAAAARRRGAGAARAARRRSAKLPPTRDILTVGNNWDGTADLVDPRRFKVLKRLNIVPDRAERMAEIQSDPAALGYFLAIRQLVGEGHDQLVDDAFTLARRPPAVRVAAELRRRRGDPAAAPARSSGARRSRATAPTTWRSRPTATRLLVSASTARKVHAHRHAHGPHRRQLRVRRPAAREQLLADGKLDLPREHRHGLHARRRPAAGPHEGRPLVRDRRRAHARRSCGGSTWARSCAEAGYPNMSSAVRPMALAPDEQTVYFQVSFFHGFVEYDLVNDRVLRLANLPLSEKAATMRREEYVLDSAHHGLAMDPSGEKLCVAGTMSDYAAIVSRTTFALPAHPGRREAVLGDQQRRRALLLRLRVGRRRGLGDLLPDGQRGRPRAGRRPPAADADGQDPPLLPALGDRDALVRRPGADVAALERGGEHVREAVGRAGEDGRAERGDLRRELVVVARARRRRRARAGRSAARRSGAGSRRGAASSPGRRPRRGR